MTHSEIRSRTGTPTIKSMLIHRQNTGVFESFDRFIIVLLIKVYQPCMIRSGALHD